MSWPRVDLALAAGLVASVTLNGALFLRDDQASGNAAIAGADPGRIAPDTRPCVPLAPKALGVGGAVDASPPTAGTDFGGETRDPAWATAQEAALESHLASLLRPHGVELSVECRSRCCQLSAEKPLTKAVMFELQTNAGLMGWSDGISFSDTVVTCFDRESSKRPLTDLVRERNRILDTESFAECARLTTVPTEVTILAVVDVKGGLQTGRQGELAGSAAARCVEKQIVAAARFGAQPEPRTVQFLVRLDPDGGR